MWIQLLDIDEVPIASKRNFKRKIAGEMFLETFNLIVGIGSSKVKRLQNLLYRFSKIYNELCICIKREDCYKFKMHSITLKKTSIIDFCSLQSLVKTIPTFTSTAYCSWLLHSCAFYMCLMNFTALM